MFDPNTILAPIKLTMKSLLEYHNKLLVGHGFDPIDKETFLEWVLEQIKKDCDVRRQ